MPEQLFEQRSHERAAGPVRLSGFGRTLSATMSPRAITADQALDAVGIPRGGGCSYGDQSLSSGGVAWRAPTGIRVGDDEVVVGGGAVLRDVLDRLAPWGRTLPVLPGSLSVTVGGAIAADAHGKNHPTVGSFGHHVVGLTLASPTGTHDLEPGDPRFNATIGGMGLTGVITRARLATTVLATGWARHTTRPAIGDDDLLEALGAMADHHEHAAAWVDLTSATTRAVVEGTDPCTRAPDGAEAFPRPARPLALPRLPASLVHRASIRLANELRWRRSTAGVTTMPLHRALAPLEAVEGFPRAYGPSGMVQHQLFLPDGREDLLVDLLAAHRDGPVVAALAVLKRLGPAGVGHLSFPGTGWTLAVDAPAGDRRLADWWDDLDRSVAAAGGRVYLAKDATMRPGVVPAMYPRLDDWRTVADDLDPDHLLSSDLDRRLGLRRPRGTSPTPPPRLGGRRA